MANIPFSTVQHKDGAACWINLGNNCTLLNFHAMIHAMKEVILEQAFPSVINISNILKRKHTFLIQIRRNQCPNTEKLTSTHEVINLSELRKWRR